MLLHLSVSHSVHRGGFLSVVTSCLAAWSHVPSGGSPCLWSHVPSGGLYLLVSLKETPQTETSLDRDPPDRDLPETPEQRPPWTETPLDRDPLYGKEWAVRILLECIIVTSVFALIYQCERAQVLSGNSGEIYYYGARLLNKLQITSQ